MNDGKIRVAEMFAGIGGFRLGLERAKNSGNSQSFRKDSKSKGYLFNSSRAENEYSPPYRTVWANEWDKYACKIYR